MNIHKLLFPGKAKLIEEMEELLLENKEQIEILNYKIDELGGGIHSITFLPEDLGFIPTEEYSDEKGYLCIYSKDGWNIARSEQDFHTFVILSPKQEKFILKIETLRDATIILKSIGMNISRDSITEEDVTL